MALPISTAPIKMSFAASWSGRKTDEKSMVGFKANPTTRFSNKVKNYTKYRPDYPRDLILSLQNKYGLTKESIVADIGFGTGILTKHFLQNCKKVLGVEPNREMRKAGEKYLSKFSNFFSINGTAEKTGLEDSSVDFIAAAQAFHWFEPKKTRREFSRILKENGRVVLIWKTPKTKGDSFHMKFNNFIKNHSSDYLKVTYQDHHSEKKAVSHFLNPIGYSLEIFEDHQNFDLEGLLGRVSSLSYMPNEWDDGFFEVKSSLEKIFNEHARNGTVKISYTTKLYISHPWNKDSIHPLKRLKSLSPKKTKF